MRNLRGTLVGKATVFVIFFYPLLVVTSILQRTVYATDRYPRHIAIWGGIENVAQDSIKNFNAASFSLFRLHWLSCESLFSGVADLLQLCNVRRCSLKRLHSKKMTAICIITPSSAPSVTPAVCAVSRAAQRTPGTDACK